MSIHYTLYFATDAKPQEVLELLQPIVEDPTIKPSPLERVPTTWWLPDGFVSIMAWPLDRLPGLAEDHGVAAKLGVDFQLITEMSHEAKTPMLRDVLALFDRVPGDAVLKDVGDTVLLRRRGGRLELNSASSFWEPEFRALVAGRPHGECAF